MAKDPPQAPGAEKPRCRTLPARHSFPHALKLTRTQRPAVGLFSGVIVTPLVNVVLLLLLFFLLGSSLVLQPGVAVSLPVAGAGLTVPALPESLVVSVQRGSPPRVYFQDQPVTLEELTARLVTAGNGEGGAPGGRTVVLRADRGLPYETVVAVGARALAAGCHVVLVTAPEEAGRTP